MARNTYATQGFAVVAALMVSAAARDGRDQTIVPPQQARQRRGQVDTRDG